MTTELATTATSDLAIATDQKWWTDKQIAALRQLGVTNASNADLAVFWHQATRTGLDPFARQIYMVERQGKWTIQTGIDGFRLIARRAVDRAHETLGYEDAQWCGPDGQWVDVWLSATAPAAARVTVLRDGQRYPGLALFSEYAAYRRDGKLTPFWENKPALMLSKCAEALALRKAFPQDLSGIYTSDEMGRAVSAPPPQDKPIERVRPAAPENDQWTTHEPPVDEETGEIIDAEVVAEAPPVHRTVAPAAGPLAREIATRPATEKQVNFLTSLAKKAGHVDLHAYLASPAATSALNGEEPSSPVTDGQCRVLIDALKAAVA